MIMFVQVLKIIIMKSKFKILVLFCSIFMSYSYSFAQKIDKKLNKQVKVFKTENFNKENSFYIKSLINDPVLAKDHLINGLISQNFDVIAENEIDNIEKSVYEINLEYQWRADTGCGGLVIKTLNGKIFDINNNNKIIATFSFSQSNFQGKCTDDVMMVLAKKLNLQ